MNLENIVHEKDQTYVKNSRPSAEINVSSDTITAMKFECPKCGQNVALAVPASRNKAVARLFYYLLSFSPPVIGTITFLLFKYGGFKSLTESFKFTMTMCVLVISFPIFMRQIVCETYYGFSCESCGKYPFKQLPGSAKIYLTVVRVILFAVIVTAILFVKVIFFN